jgi:uncharacterized protein
MILSEERQSHLAHVIVDGIWNDDLVEFNDEDAAVRIAKKAIVDWVKEEDTLDQNVRDKVSSLKRNVIEGTPEWEIMYSKYYAEEMVKRGYKK